MDDLVIPSRDYEEGLLRLKQVLETTSSYGLEFNWAKCNFLEKRINYLGFWIKDGKVTASEEKTDAVKNFPKPSNARALQSFLGRMGYFPKFIPQYSLIARPLTSLLRNGIDFKLGEEEDRACSLLKSALSDMPVLHLY